jgi:hypothetical protein
MIDKPNGRNDPALEQVREMKLRALRQAARQGFDQIDQGRGIAIHGEKALHRFFREIEAEAGSDVCTVENMVSPVHGASRGSGVGPAFTPG